MIKLLLKAKHWQLFTLGFGIPMIIQFVVMARMFMNIIGQRHPTPSLSFMLDYFIVNFVIILLFTSIILAWNWSVVIGLQSKVPMGIGNKLKRFKAFFFIPIVYTLFLFVFIYVSIMTFAGGGKPSPVFFLSFILIIPLHLFAIFCNFHTVYFVAKTFKTVELQREVSFSDFVGEFFLLWFYPIGVWILQPKINKMIEE